jgi:hypothetical protein
MIRELLRTLVRDHCVAAIEQDTRRNARGKVAPMKVDVGKGRAGMPLTARTC